MIHDAPTGEQQDRRRQCCTMVVKLLTLVCLIIFAVFAFLNWRCLHRPPKPDFLLRELTVYHFNATSVPAAVSAKMSVTFSSRNRDSRTGISYAELHAYAAYRGQPITLPIRLPDSNQDPKAVTGYRSEFLCGSKAPVAPSLGTALARDLDVGIVAVDLRIEGNLQWKDSSRKHHLRVNCPAKLMLKGSDSGGAAVPVLSGMPMKFELQLRCKVKI